MKHLKYTKFLILFIVLLSTCTTALPQLNGNYTIGGTTPNYATIQVAVNDLNAQGVSGNVNFKLRPGVYNEKITFGAVSGASPNAVVTFESELADSASVWWTSSSANDATNYTVQCVSTKYIQFKNISFKTTGYGSGVFIISSGTSNLTIENCHFYKLAMPATNYSRHRQIYSSNQIDSNLYILNNYFENAGYAFADYGQSTSLRDSNIVVEGNRMECYQGILLSNVENCSVRENQIYAEYRGIMIDGFGNPLNIDRNKVYAFEKALYVHQNSGNPTTFSPLWVTNNFLSGTRGAVDVLSGSGSTQVVNNTIYNRQYGGNYHTITINTSVGLKTMFY